MKINLIPNAKYTWEYETLVFNGQRGETCTEIGYFTGAFSSNPEFYGWPQMAVQTEAGIGYMLADPERIKPA